MGKGDLIFFEMGEKGAHHLYNHTEEPVTYLDIRTYIGFDQCEYPDSGKVLYFPSYEIYRKEAATGYYEGEENVREIWEKLKDPGSHQDPV